MLSNISTFQKQNLTIPYLNYVRKILSFFHKKTTNGHLLNGRTPLYKMIIYLSHLFLYLFQQTSIYAKATPFQLFKVIKNKVKFSKEFIPLYHLRKRTSQFTPIGCCVTRLAATIKIPLDYFSKLMKIPRKSFLKFA